MIQATQERVHRGGFTASRVFGWELPEKFPSVKFTEAQVESAAIIIEIPAARGLRLSSLSKVILGAAKGGIKTAVVTCRGEKLVTSLDMLTLWLNVEEMAELRSLLIQETKERREG
ncbi:MULTISPECIES: hypothetical protein [unclassified Streptomyces]|uniref:hypothetical protein n=1 Tax=unclassified Streptomyces TaxID=2593676 RepID=UPI00081DE0EA|nr:MULTISPECIES: hypothetical protein [unclassified Streptomyces]MYR95446.1 hypothetical protein [Streptomyces sp. SID4937]SCD90477.1 hypothetical protein GA0115243_104724 [Streptomyces sp. ScaeMP-e83]